VKVIHLISGGDTGGAKTHIHYLLAGLNKSIEATLVCFTRGEFSDEAQALGIPTVVFDGANIFSAVSRLKTMIKDGGYDLIHSHGAKGNFVASLIKRSCGLPVVTTVHSDPKLDYLGRPMAKLVYGNLNAYALKRADYLVGVSDSMRELLISRGFCPNSVFSIYNGTDFSVSPENSDKTAYFRACGLETDGDSVVVGIAARLDPVKDVATLVRGFAEASKTCPQLRLAIAGDGQQMEELKELAAQLGVSERICFMGWVTDMNSFYGAIDINALTSLSETFPYALTEGARARLATVSSRVGGVPVLISEGETGLLFEPGDYMTLAKKLGRLADDKALREKLGNAVYDKALREFSVEAMTRRQIEIYNEVLRRRQIKKSGGRDGIIVSGAYGMGNAGDDAILEAIVAELRRINPFIPMTALSRDPKQTRLRFGIESVYTFDFLSFHRAMRRSKLYISGGGSLIQNITSRRSLWYYLYTIKSAKMLGNKVMMYGCGIGPVTGKWDIKIAAKVINSCVDVITLREKFSREELSRFGVTKPEIVVSSDPALTLKPASADRVDEVFRKSGLSPEGKYICFSVRKWTNFDEKAPIFAAAADFARDNLGLEPVFVNINIREDAAATELVRSQMIGQSGIISVPMDIELTIGVLSRMRAMISMRLHGLIFAASQGVPLVGVSYDPKVTAFLESVGEKLCIPYEELCREDLEAMLQTAASGFEDSCRRADTVEKLIALEKINSTMAGKLLNS
jgi:polysaccharide pyruvyl transferase CsaB